MGRAIRCHRQDMKTCIINGSEVFRLSVAIQMEATGEPQKHHRTLNQ